MSLRRERGNPSPRPDDELAPALVEGLARRAAEWTGFRPEAVERESVRRAARAWLARGDRTTGELLAGVERRDPEVVRALRQAVSVGETYFFRQPEHFDFLVERWLPARFASGRRSIRAWSAGCATGEEAYSLAACLADVARDSGTRVQVTGSDHLERNLEVARAGSYGPWSIRESAPLRHAVLERADGDRARVSRAVRSLVTFVVQDLLTPAPFADGCFDLVFCRNVFVYFAPEAIERALAHILRTLQPDGLLVLGTMDADVVLPGLAHVGPPGTTLYARRAGAPAPPRARVATPPSTATPRRAPRPAAETPPKLPDRESAPPRGSRDEPIALHLAVLEHIERGDEDRAARALAELRRRSPDYLPALLEEALQGIRAGDRTRAARLMRELLQRTASLPEEHVVAGPEALPVSFYRASAEAFLEG